jgi:hypothetical protein
VLSSNEEAVRDLKLDKSTFLKSDVTTLMKDLETLSKVLQTASVFS